MGVLQLAAAHGLHHVLPTVILQQGIAITSDNYSVVSARFAASLFLRNLA